MTRPRLQTVLLVDDEHDVRMVAKMALEFFGGLRVLDVPSGEEALAIAAEERPDLILLDVMMPGMDGPMTLKSLRGGTQTAKIPVVFLTAKTLPEEMRALRQLGALYVVEKPFDPATLATEIESVWSRYAQ